MNELQVIVFLAGVFQLLMGVFRLDFLSSYLSEQVLLLDK
jgi:MFS superfamily sulfate permease-like transporter